ncbi:interleukin-13 receptor subunit alpha-1-like [Seriola aureovittata]|uniref:interleukin-13 receptor subunit alpha-1-like n=1 Tax=Seriola aureovittata TaxID=2871759 RepID=UPI0024BDDA72|nr:interleukin-13 receptor subunit alpha-1-like [Seriola aureovittata]
MTFTGEFFAILSCTAMIMLLHCNADPLPPPTDLSYEWLDPFTVNVSWLWQRPSNLPKDCEIMYDFEPNAKPDNRKRIESRNVSWICLTGVTGSQSCTFTIYTVGIKESCLDWKSTSENITIKSPKPQAKVVEDFKCVLDPMGMNCSWIPVYPAYNLTLSYKTYGVTEAVTNSKDCHQYYSSGRRNGCYLELSDEQLFKTYILVDNDIGRSTFEALNTSIVIPSPQLNITQDKYLLNLSWETPKVGDLDCWIYVFNYTECNKPMKSQKTTTNTYSIPYDENCLYEIQSRVETKTCLPIRSDLSEVVTYGTNRPRDGTLTVVAIVIPIILCVCVILSCYCFRKHSNILCPIIPDPSAIFKEMMMNGNKDHKTGSLYTPVPEPVEPCKITIAAETSVLQQNS